MALYNLGYCYTQVGDKQKAIEYYQKTLAEFPDSRMAREALNILMLR